MRVNDSSESRVLDGLESSRFALLEVLSDWRRTVRWYTPWVHPDLYNDEAVVDAIRQRVVTQPKVRLQFVLPSAPEWRDSCPGLARLVERLTSAILIHTLEREELPDRAELGQAFWITDERTLLCFRDPRRLLGNYEPWPTERVKEFLDLFQTLWSRSVPDSYLRRLGL